MSSTDTSLTFNTYQMREANGESVLSSDPIKQTRYTKFNKQYLEGLCENYIDTIDKMICQINQSDDLDPHIKNKIIALMISLVLDRDDLLELKKSSRIKEISMLIPNMTEISFINDVPFDIDIVEAVYRYIIQLLKGTDLLRGSQFGGIAATEHNNLKDYNDVFSTYILGKEDDTLMLVQNIDTFNKKNKLIRQRLLDFATKGKGVNKKDEIKIRREFKFDDKTQSFVRREKPIAKKVLDLLAEKLFVAYDRLADYLEN